MSSKGGDSRSRGDTIESGELRKWRHNVKAITDAHVLLYGNGDSWSSSSEEEHAILLGALAALQQINDEEEKEKLKKRKRCSGEGN